MRSVANSVQGSLKLFADLNKFKRLEVFNNNKAEDKVIVAQLKLEESRTGKDRERYLNFTKYELASFY